MGKGVIIKTQTTTAKSHAAQLQSVSISPLPQKETISYTTIGDIQEGVTANSDVYEKATEGNTDVMIYGKDISQYTDAVIAEDNQAGNKISVAFANG